MIYFSFLPHDALIVVISAVSNVWITLSNTFSTSSAVKMTSWCSDPMCLATCLAANMSGLSSIPIENVCHKQNFRCSIVF